MICSDTVKKSKHLKTHYYCGRPDFNTLKKTDSLKKVLNNMRGAAVQLHLSASLIIFLKFGRKTTGVESNTWKKVYIAAPSCMWQYRWALIICRFGAHRFHIHGSKLVGEGLTWIPWKWPKLCSCHSGGCSETHKGCTHPPPASVDLRMPITGGKNPLLEMMFLSFYKTFWGPGKPCRGSPLTQNR